MTRNFESIVDDHKPRLVELAEQWVEGGDFAAARVVEKSQLRLLLRAAQTEPRKVLFNLLRYQVGRAKGFYRNNTARSDGTEAEVDERLLALIGKTLPKMAATADVAEADRPRLESALATHLFAFIVREHTFQVQVLEEGGRS